MKKPRVLCIGGMNMDILGQADSAFAPGDSLPGIISMRPGGVARNIAAQLANLGAQVELLCPLGNDQAADSLRASCHQLGIGLNLAIPAPFPSPSYLAIHDESGDMVAAINDMRAMDALRPQALLGRLAAAGAFDACVLDANLSADSLLFLASHLQMPLIADPVSAVKCRRLLPIMGSLAAFKPNLMEARAMSGQDSMERAAQALLATGLPSIFISLGKDGLYYADAVQAGHLDALPIPRVSLTGAGDAMTAGLTLGLAQGLDTVEIARLGLQSAFNFLTSKQAETSGKETS